MIQFGQGYIYIEGKVYKEMKPDTRRKTPRWKLTDKTGKQHWVSQKGLEAIVKRKQKMI